MFTALKRYLHSHGFGVHSPYGYRFVCSVISPARGYAYYAEETIDHTLSRDSEHYYLSRAARTLLRVAVFTSPSYAYLPAKAHKCFRTALRASNSHIRISDNPSRISEADFVAVTGDSVPLDKLCDFISCQNHTLLIKDVPATWVDRLFEAMKEGIAFEGERNCILISHPGIWKVRYIMNL